MSAVDAALPVVPRREESILAGNIRDFAANRMSVVAAVICLAFCLIALLAPVLAPQNPYESDLLRRLQPPAWMEGGEWAFPFGCDALGRDVLSRMIYGTRVSIIIGIAVVLIATVIGTTLGLAAGYLRGSVDLVVARVCDILLGFPYLIFAIALMAMMGPGLQNIILALCYKEWVLPCRVVRAETLAAREQD